MFYKGIIIMFELEDSAIQVKFYKFVLVYFLLKEVNQYKGGWGEN